MGKIAANFDGLRFECHVVQNRDAANEHLCVTAHRRGSWLHEDGIGRVALDACGRVRTLKQRNERGQRPAHLGLVGLALRVLLHDGIMP